MLEHTMSLNFKAMVFAGTLMAANLSSIPEVKAGQIRVSAEYSISFAGIPVARSKFQTEINGTNLSLKGSLATAGLAAMFDSTTATSVSAGAISKKGVQSQNFAMEYQSGKKSRSTRIGFRGGNVIETVITPERPANPNNAPIAEGELNGVSDPFLASLIWAESPADVCNRTLRVFDGVLRINLVMRPAGTDRFVIGGVTGEGVRCAVRYQPVGGHRLKSGSVSYMAEGERAVIVFGALAGTKLYGPVKATVKTKSGTVAIRATKFEQSIE